MFDNTIHAKTIARHFRARDFHSTIWSAAAVDRENILTEAVDRAALGFEGMALRRSERAGKTIYQHASLSEALLTRHITESVRRVTGVRQSDRQAIVKSLIQLSSEGLDFGILKFDIKSFYESLNTSEIVASLRRDAAFSRQSVRLLQTFFDDLEQAGIVGLPRGISLSATLAEYALRDFDAAVRAQIGVRFYNRYVDDGIIIASSKVALPDLSGTISATLPRGVHFNRSKTKSFNFQAFDRASGGTIEHAFTFLGYRLQIMRPIRDGGIIKREVNVDISPSKVSRFKRRMARALLTYQNDSNFNDLRDRIRLLTSNFGYIDNSSGQQRYAGLRYNYGLIDPQKSPALVQLDQYLRNVITSKHPNNRLRPAISKQQQHTLLGLSFKDGFIDNRFFSFSTEDLKRLTGCWNYA